MLTQHEAENTYEELQKALRDVGLEHVVDEVADNVRLGKIESKKVKVSEREMPEDYLLSVAPQRTRMKTETFTGSVEFTSHEKLEMLIRAIERATVELSEMHEASAKLLAHVRGAPDAALREGFSTFMFVGQGREGELKSDPVVRRKFSEACASLNPLLKELKETIHAPAQ